MKPRSVLRFTHSQRGTMLAVYICIIPAALVLYTLTLTRLDVAFAETQRHRGSVQARLLAESALAVLQDRFARLPDPLRGKIEGKIEGVGQYWAEAVKGTDASRGSDVAKMGDVAKGIETAIKASPAPGGALRPVYRVGGTVENVRTRHVCTMDIAVRDGALEVQTVSTRLLPLPPPPRPHVELTSATLLRLSAFVAAQKTSPGRASAPRSARPAAPPPMLRFMVKP